MRLCTKVYKMKFSYFLHSFWCIEKSTSQSCGWNNGVNISAKCFLGNHQEYRYTILKEQEIQTYWYSLTGLQVLKCIKFTLQFALMQEIESNYHDKCCLSVCLQWLNCSHHQLVTYDQKLNQEKNLWAFQYF